jgi:uncharacterized protein
MSIAVVAATADRFFAAVGARDIEAASALYADDIVIWHNTDGIEQTRDENLKVMAWLIRKTTSMTYTNVRRVVDADGFAQQHDLELVLPSGATAQMSACMFVKVSGGQFHRIDEYLDGAAAAGLFTTER